jgi:hypothetical protein
MAYPWILRSSPQNVAGGGGPPPASFPRRRESTKEQCSVCEKHFFSGCCGMWIAALVTLARNDSVPLAWFAPISLQNVAGGGGPPPASFPRRRESKEQRSVCKKHFFSGRCGMWIAAVASLLRNLSDPH